MATESTEISNEQAQELMDAIINQCEEMKLEPTQILDGISRSLLGALMSFGTKDLNVDIENVGTVQVSVFDQEKETLENSQTNTYKLTDLAIKIITFMRISDFNVNQKLVKKSMNKYWDKLSILEKEGIDSALQELVGIEIITSNFVLTDKGFKTIYTPSQCFYEFKGWDGNIPQYEAILKKNKRWFVALKP